MMKISTFKNGNKWTVRSNGQYIKLGFIFSSGCLVEQYLLIRTSNTSLTTTVILEIKKDAPEK